MATVQEITDRLTAATVKAEDASEIQYQVANGDENTSVPTASGPTPSIKKWYQSLGEAIEPWLASIPARLDRSILSYATESDAEAAAATLPDGQEVVAPSEIGAFTHWRVQSGVLQEVGKIALDVTQFGARTTNTSEQNDIAFAVAATAAGNAPIYVPAGLWHLTIRDTVPAQVLFYGPGVLRLDTWEIVGRFDGGTQKFSWPVYFDSQSDCHIYVDGVEVSLTWLSDRTVQYTSAAAPNTTNVVFRVYGAKINLGSVPTNPVLDSVYTEIPRNISQTFSHTGTNGRDATTAASNTSHGPKALMSLTTGSGNTVYGTRAGGSIKDGANHVLIGFQAGHRIVSGEGNTGVGTLALEHLTSGQYNVAIGFNAQGSKTEGSNNVSVGAETLWSWGTCNNNTAMGHRALANGNGTGENNVAMGTFSQDFAAGTSNTSIGYRALNGSASSSGKLSGNDNVVIGAFAGRYVGGSSSQNTVLGTLALGSANQASNLTAVGYATLQALTTGSANTAVGHLALKSITTGSNCVAVGNGALENATGGDNTAIGMQAINGATTGTGNTATGFNAGRFITSGSGNTTYGWRAGRSITTGASNTAIGSDALNNITDGGSNTAIGNAAGRFLVDGSAANTTNSTTVGANSRVSGNNQVQLGVSGTTTYAFGAVQDRSDARDKSDVRDTVLGLDFINDLRAVDFRWDMRDDYVETVSRVVDREVIEEFEVPTGLLDANAQPIMRSERVTRIVSETVDEVVRLERDGSKKRNRFHHGLIAQELREVMERHSVDFGGFQDHSANGGCDVLSIGYTELIAPLIKAVQELSARVEELEAKA